MMFLLFFLLVTATIAFVWLSQYFIGNIPLILCYSFLILGIGIVFFVLIKQQQKKASSKLLHILEETLHGQNFDDKHLSCLESKLYFFVKSNLETSHKLQADREQIETLVSDISHQIKTPLSNIILYADLLQEKEPSTYTANILQQAQKLQFLFEALIKLSRCENGLITGNLQIEQNNVKELLASTISDVYSMAEKKQIAIITDCDAAHTAQFDKKWTSEAVRNVLENAIKYSPVKSQITIRVMKYSLFLRIDIEDSGIGMSETILPNIWKRFYRGESVKNENGVGIGLYLTFLILSSQGGYSSAKSKVGEGSLFSIFLPLA